MANTRQNAHHSLDGDELRAIIESRVKQGILQAMNLRAMYAFPVVKYRVTIEVIPFTPQGSSEPIPDGKSIQRCVIEGQEFVEVREEAVELVHDSPIIGWESDPQKERDDTGLGRVETKRVEGQYVDVHVGKRIEIEEPELPPLRERGPRVQPAPVRPPVTNALGKDHKPVGDTTVLVVPVNTEGIAQQEAERIAKMEAETWSAPSPDAEFHNAIANEDMIPGRVSKLVK